MFQRKHFRLALWRTWPTNTSLIRYCPQIISFLKLQKYQRGGPIKVQSQFLGGPHCPPPRIRSYLIQTTKDTHVETFLEDFVICKMERSRHVPSLIIMCHSTRSSALPDVGWLIKRTSQSMAVTSPHRTVCNVWVQILQVRQWTPYNIPASLSSLDSIKFKFKFKTFATANSIVLSFVLSYYLL